MILHRALSLVAAVAAMAAAVAACVVAAALALYAFLRVYVGPAGAAAVLALVAAAAAAIFALIAVGRAWPRRLYYEEEPSLGARLIDLAREKPLVAAGVAAAAGFVLFRNPRLAGAAVSALMSGRPRDDDWRDRRGRRRW